MIHRDSVPMSANKQALLVDLIMVANEQQCLSQSVQETSYKNLMRVPHFNDFIRCKYHRL